MKLTTEQVLKQTRFILKQVDAAIENQKPGYEFLGAFGEAAKAGYCKSTPQFDLFVGLFYSQVESLDISINNKNVIL